MRFTLERYTPIAARLIVPALLGLSAIACGAVKGLVAPAPAAAPGQPTAPPAPPPDVFLTYLPGTPIPPLGGELPQVPTSPPPGTPAPSGLEATFALNEARTEYAAGEQIWFTFDLRNATAQTITLGIVGVGIEQDGQNLADLFKTSWSGSSLDPGGELNWSDWTSIPTPGRYVLRLSVCTSPQETCLSGGNWEDLGQPIEVQIN
jgi:hypothetical protein